MSHLGGSEAEHPPRAPRGRGDARGYWRANMRLILVLLAVWAAVSYGCSILLVEQLNQVQVPLIKVPLGFWMAQQGSIYIFVLLIFIYAWRMDRIDQKYNVEE